MSKKLTIEYVKGEIEKVEGYKLLSEEHVNAKTKVEVRCPEGHEYKVLYHAFKNGSRCYICAGNQRHTYEYVKEYIESKGYKLLSKEYKNNHTKLELMCPKGHKFWMTYGNFHYGQRCPQCHYNNMKFTIKDVKGKIEKVKGYKLLSEVYKGNHIKLKLQCPKGHIFWMSLAIFQQGNRCAQCWRENLKHTIEYVKEYIENKGYKLLSEKYKGAHTKLELQCPEGHVFWMTWACFEQGQRCPQCYKDNQKLTYEDVKEYIESRGYKLLSKEYKNSITKLELRCPEGHKFWMTYGNFQQEHRCPECCYENVSSKGEKEVLEYIQSLTNDTTIIENDRTQIINPKTGCNLELDIFFPDLMKAIEYNGTYWHSSDYVKYKDNQKVIQCEELGIEFLVINENEWINNKEGCKKYIRKLLGE